MSGVARRKFLSLLAMAPVAAPVVAKEAATRMGLSSMAAAAFTGDQFYPGGVGSAMTQPTSNGDWIKQQIDQFVSPEARSGRLMQARQMAGRLDPDLAAMKSVSPSWAYAAQCDRAIARIEQNELSWLRKEADRSGLGWMLP